MAPEWKQDVAVLQEKVKHLEALEPRIAKLERLRAWFSGVIAAVVLLGGAVNWAFGDFIKRKVTESLNASTDAKTVAEDAKRVAENISTNIQQLAESAITDASAKAGVPILAFGQFQLDKGKRPQLGDDATAKLSGEHVAFAPPETYIVTLYIGSQFSQLLTSTASLGGLDHAVAGSSARNGVFLTSRILDKQRIQVAVSGNGGYDTIVVNWMAIGK